MDSLPPGLTCSSLTWKRGPMFSVSKWPQGRWFRRCCSCSLRPLLRRRSTILETSCARCAVGHQQRVGRVDDDEIAHADGRHQRLLAVDVAVVRVLEHGGAAGEVAGRVARRQLPQRRPRADVAPADVDRQHRRLVGALHHGIVDGDAGRASRRPWHRGAGSPDPPWLRRAPPWPLPGWPAAGAPSSSRNARAPSTKMPLFQA